METARTSQADRYTAPRPLRIAVGVALAFLCLGAVYLYAVRGNAIILDLANGLAGMLCM
jgi:hypothetical protein